jgi:hypothetical protein
MREQRRRRRERTTERHQRKAAAPTWLRGAGQLALAAVLAAVLLAVIITVRDWNKSGGDVADPPSNSPYYGAEAAQPDFGQAHLEPVERLEPAGAVDASPGPELTPPTFSGSAAQQRQGELAAPEMTRRDLPSMAAPKRSARSWDESVTGASSDRTARDPVPQRGYPSTGVDSALTSPEVAPSSERGWHETLPASRVRRADRSESGSYRRR